MTDLEHDSDFHPDDLANVRTSSLDSHQSYGERFSSMDRTTEALDESRTNMRQNQSVRRSSLRTVNKTFQKAFTAEQTGETRKRSVRFHKDTIFHEPPYHIALSIPSSHLVKDMNCTVYTIQIICQNQAWSVCRRYRDFEDLHKSIVQETVKGYGTNGSESDSRYKGPVKIDQRLLPLLPKKRWFEKQRWLNRNDEKFSNERRKGLERYLRTILRHPQMKMESISLHTFLNEDQRIEAFTEYDKLHFKQQSGGDCAEDEDEPPTESTDAESVQEEGKEEVGNSPEGVFEFAIGSSPYSDRDESFSSCNNGYNSVIGDSDVNGNGSSGQGEMMVTSDEEENGGRRRVSFTKHRDSILSLPNRPFMDAFMCDKGISCTDGDSDDEKTVGNYS
jgi:hypothetical protein